MAGETTITVTGNLTADPEVRFLPSSAAVANFTVASTPRYRKDDTWVHGDALFLRCTAWRHLAEHIAESLRKGMRVIGTGRLRQRSWETPEGERRSVVEVEIDDIAPSLRYATARVTKTVAQEGPGDTSRDDEPPF